MVTKTQLCIAAPPVVPMALDQWRIGVVVWTNLHTEVRFWHLMGGLEGFHDLDIKNYMQTFLFVTRWSRNKPMKLCCDNLKFGSSGQLLNSINIL